MFFLCSSACVVIICFSFSDNENVEQEEKFSAPYIASQLCFKLAFEMLCFAHTNKNSFLFFPQSILLRKLNLKLDICLDRPSPAGEDGVIEGVLTRKHEWESTTKKASNRSWDKVRHSIIIVSSITIETILRCTFCHDLDVYHSTKTRKRQRVSQSKHSAVSQHLNSKVQMLKSPTTTQRRSTCSGSSECFNQSQSLGFLNSEDFSF